MYWLMIKLTSNSLLSCSLPCTSSCRNVATCNTLDYSVGHTFITFDLPHSRLVFFEELGIVWFALLAHYIFLNIFICQVWELFWPVPELVCAHIVYRCLPTSIYFLWLSALLLCCIIRLFIDCMIILFVKKTSWMWRVTNWKANSSSCFLKR